MRPTGHEFDMLGRIGVTEQTVILETENSGDAETHIFWGVEAGQPVGPMLWDLKQGSGIPPCIPA